MSCSKGCNILLNLLMILKSLGYLFVAIVLILTMMSVSGVPTEVDTALSDFLSSVNTGLEFMGAKPDLLDSLKLAIPYIILGAGALSLFVGVWGVVATAKQHKCLLSTAAVLLLLVFAVEALFAVMTGLGLSNEFSIVSNANFIDAYDGNDSPSMLNTTRFKAALMTLEKSQKCCGVNGSSDYTTLMPMVSVPQSCCPDVNATATCEANVTDVKGCGGLVGRPLPEGWIPIGVIIGLGCITLLALIFTLGVCCSDSKDV